jgi:2-(1,2-epoxy-1,2-dihydrophenyl)acetyl-CoA isomerase
LNTGAISEEFVRSTVTVVETLYRLRPVTVAAVNGACAGGGMALACAADVRIAARSAVFATAYLQIGTTGDLGLPWQLVRLVGLSRAKELSLLGERVTADAAARIGLVQRVAADSEFPQEVERLVARLAGFAPLALTGLKANLNDAFELGFSQFLDVESRRFAANTLTADAAEAVQAFIERRAPRFSGR